MIRAGRFFRAGTQGQKYPFVRGTLGQVGAEPGLARKLLGTPSARQAAANRGVREGGDRQSVLSVLDSAIEGTPIGKAMGFGPARPPGKGPEGRHGPWSKSEPIGLANKHPKREVGVKPAAPRTNAPQDE